VTGRIPHTRNPGIKKIVAETFSVYTVYMNMHSEFILSKTDGRPMYLQIMEQIKLRIASGDWPEGFKLPSIRELAIAIQVSIITVKRAYLELERENMIYTQQGVGSFVSESDGHARKHIETEIEGFLSNAAKLAIAQGQPLQDFLNQSKTVYQKMHGETSE